MNGRMPRLTYTPPADLYHSALRPPEIYESSQVNASLQVYAFRPAPPNIGGLFHQTLLRDWIASQYQELQLAGPPTFHSWMIVGADSAQFCQFGEAAWQPKPRMRLLIEAQGAAAIVDAQAQSPEAWTVASQSFQMLIATLRVETGSGDTGGRRPTSATSALAGLYVGVKPKFVSAIGPGIGAGSGGFVQAQHLYLFSDDGRVYRAYDDIPIAGDHPGDFDFDEAAVADPVNSGRYSIRGRKLTLQMGERLDEVIVVALQQPGRLTIENVDYHRE